MVFLALAFWTWLWGPLGAFLAVPLSIIGLVVFNHLFPTEDVKLARLNGTAIGSLIRSMELLGTRTIIVGNWLNPMHGEFSMNTASTASQNVRDAAKDAREGVREVGKAAAEASGDIQSDLQALRDDFAKLAEQVGEHPRHQGQRRLAEGALERR